MLERYANDCLGSAPRVPGSHLVYRAIRDGIQFVDWRCARGVCVKPPGLSLARDIDTVIRVSFVGASFSTHIWHLLLSQGICFGLGLGFCFTSTVGVVPQWFTKRRSFANSVATCGSGFGGLIYSLGTNAMIANLGLAWAFRILAILAFVVNGACSLVLRDRNKAVGAVHVPFHTALFKRTEFWLFIGWGFFGLMSYVIVVFSIVDYAQQVGFTASQGSLAAAIFNRKPTTLTSFLYNWLTLHLRCFSIPRHR